MSEMDIEKLVAAALDSLKRSYAPYSDYCVGAALLTESGAIYQGCNVENVSYGLSICAERNAVFAAVANGERCFKAMAIVACGEQEPFPCGACRQVLAEFCKPDFPIFIVDENEVAESFSLAELLPYAFGDD